MKLLVRDFLRMKHVLELDTDTGALASVEGVDPKRARGYFAKLGDTPVTFYAADGKLQLRIGDEEHTLSGAVKIEFAGEGLRTLRVKSGDDVLGRVSYPNPVNPPMEFDLTMAEEEDFDLGLYVKNVMASHDRKQRMLARWS